MAKGKENCVQALSPRCMGVHTVATYKFMHVSWANLVTLLSSHRQQLKGTT